MTLLHFVTSQAAAAAQASQSSGKEAIHARLACFDINGLFKTHYLVEILSTTPLRTFSVKCWVSDQGVQIRYGLARGMRFAQTSSYACMVTQTSCYPVLAVGDRTVATPVSLDFMNRVDTSRFYL